ncbi:MAG: alpha/beta hydrolase [Marivirga sp.]|nr:alpha/beta hydrolase [Marivirga sp.]
MKELFLISGLGADKRVFDFLDLSEYKTHHIQWVDPHHKESIESYASRLSSQITKDRPILIGVSFGGLIAIEIGKQIKTEKVIIISSAKSKKDIPSGYLARKLKLHTLIPSRFLKKPTDLLFWFFGVESKKEKILLQSIIKDTDERFLSWAIDKIVTWENNVELNNLIHIHGTRDRMMPYRSADYKIEGGGHLMIINRAADIDVILKTILNKQGQV